MMWDITFCSNTNCKNTECKRNQNNYNLILAPHDISIADFSKTCTKKEVDK